MNLGNWTIGTPSRGTATLNNTQTVAMTIQSISASGDFTETSTCPITPATLAAGASCTISVVFTPTALGARTGTLTVTSSSSSSPQTVALTGNGVAPVVMTPGKDAYGTQAVGTTSAAKTFTLMNYQIVPVTISGISTSGDFAATSTCPVSPSTLAKRTSCQVSVTFTPTAAGARTGQLTVGDDASNTPQTATLSGTGTAALAALPAAVSFGTDIVDTTSQAQTITLKNDLTVAMKIYGIAISGDFAKQSTTCPSSQYSLLAGATCTVSVTFTPTALGATTGALTVTNSGSTTPTTVNLQGTGILSTPIEHVVIIFQENRTPDNLFHDPVLIARGADIASSGLNSKGQTIPLIPVPLANNWDMGHNHPPFLLEYDGGKMDGEDLVALICKPNCPLPAGATGYAYVQASDVQPYFQMAEQYAFADRMFQTNQGASFPSHQFIISGTSAPTATSDLFASENPQGGTLPGTDTGCTAPAGQHVALIDPEGSEAQTQYPCFEHASITDFLDNAGLSWRYYTTSGGLLWTGPNAIEHMRLGPDWANVITPDTAIITDIKAGNLPAVSWVIPRGQASDHPNTNLGQGPSWVASVVNAIGNSKYWASTAILITWDDWGGWYDHVAPPILNSYEYGFRVPLIVVSPYAKPAYISHQTHDYGSMLKFIEKNYGLPSLGYADAPADDLSDCFNYSQTPIKFIKIAAPLPADFFMNDKTPALDPDDD
jgi:phospholipase C